MIIYTAHKSFQPVSGSEFPLPLDMQGLEETVIRCGCGTRYKAVNIYRHCAFIVLRTEFIIEDIIYISMLWYRRIRRYISACNPTYILTSYDSLVYSEYNSDISEFLVTQNLCEEQQL